MLNRILMSTIAVAFAATSAAAGSQDSWDIQYGGTTQNLTRDVDYYNLDIDGHEAAVIAELKSRGISPICYVSVGTVEDYRSDKSDFPPEVVGKVYGDWPDEKFLDIRQMDVLLPIMEKRFQKCKDLGYIGIDPDNQDIYLHDTGFPLTGDDIVAYMTALAEIAHNMGLQIGQKNVPDLTDRLIDTLDFVVSESCYKWNHCDKLLPYIERDKPTLNIEYVESNIDFKSACEWSRENGGYFLLKNRNLDASQTTCEEVLGDGGNGDGGNGDGGNGDGGNGDGGNGDGGNGDGGNGDGGNGDGGNGDGGNGDGGNGDGGNGDGGNGDGGNGDGGNGDDGSPDPYKECLRLFNVIKYRGLPFPVDAEKICRMRTGG